MNPPLHHWPQVNPAHANEYNVSARGTSSRPPRTPSHFPRHTSPCTPPFTPLHAQPLHTRMHPHSTAFNRWTPRTHTSTTWARGTSSRQLRSPRSTWSPSTSASLPSRAVSCNLFCFLLVFPPSTKSPSACASRPFRALPSLFHFIRVCSASPRSAECMESPRKSTRPLSPLRATPGCCVARVPRSSHRPLRIIRCYAMAPPVHRGTRRAAEGPDVSYIAPAPRSAAGAP